VNFRCAAFQSGHTNLSDSPARKGNQGRIANAGYRVVTRLMYCDDGSPVRNVSLAHVRDAAQIHHHNINKWNFDLRKPSQCANAQPRELTRQSFFKSCSIRAGSQNPPRFVSASDLDYSRKVRTPIFFSLLRRESVSPNIGRDRNSSQNQRVSGGINPAGKTVIITIYIPPFGAKVEKSPHYFL